MGRPLKAVGAEGLGPGTGVLAAPGTMWVQRSGPRVWSLPVPAGLTHAQALAGGPPPPPQQLDPENTGFIGADTFTGLVHSHELPLDPAKLDTLVALAQSNERGQVCYQELVDLVSAMTGRQQGYGPRPGQRRVGRHPSLPALPTREGCGLGQGLRLCEKLGGPKGQGGWGGWAASMMAHA